MNVRGLANQLTRAINPNINATARICLGYQATPDYKREPAYADPVPVTIQAQALSKKEIEHLDSLNLSNATRAAYANIQLTGVDRNDQSGGDLLLFAEPTAPEAVNEWLVIAVLEGWSTAGWTKVAIGKQLS